MRAALQEVLKLDYDGIKMNPMAEFVEIEYGKEFLLEFEKDGLVTNGKYTEYYGVRQKTLYDMEFGNELSPGEHTLAQTYLSLEDYVLKEDEVVDAEKKPPLEMFKDELLTNVVKEFEKKTKSPGPEASPPDVDDDATPPGADDDAADDNGYDDKVWDAPDNGDGEEEDEEDKTRKYLRKTEKQLYRMVLQVFFRLIQEAAKIVDDDTPQVASGTNAFTGYQKPTYPDEFFGGREPKSLKGWTPICAHDKESIKIMVEVLNGILKGRQKRRRSLKKKEEQQRKAQATAERNGARNSIDSTGSASTQSSSGREDDDCSGGAFSEYFKYVQKIQDLQSEAGTLVEVYEVGDASSPFQKEAIEKYTHYVLKAATALYQIIDHPRFELELNDTPFRLMGRKARLKELAENKDNLWSLESVLTKRMMFNEVKNVSKSIKLLQGQLLERQKKTYNQKRLMNEPANNQYDMLCGKENHIGTKMGQLGTGVDVLQRMLLPAPYVNKETQAAKTTELIFDKAKAFVGLIMINNLDKFKVLQHNAGNHLPRDCVKSNTKGNVVIYFPAYHKPIQNTKLRREALQFIHQNMKDVAQAFEEESKGMPLSKSLKHVTLTSSIDTACRAWTGNNAPNGSKEKYKKAKEAKELAEAEAEERLAPSG